MVLRDTLLFIDDDQDVKSNVSADLLQRPILDSVCLAVDETLSNLGDMGT